VGSTTIAVHRKKPWLVAFIGVLLALGAILMQPPLAASTETTDDGQEVTDFYFGGVITFDDEPVEGVELSVSGSGFEGETETDAEGKWRLYVPEKETYTITVNEETLPDGVIVDASLLPEGTQPISGTTASFEVEFGLTGTKILNLFLGEGERITVSYIDQLASRLVGGLNFGLLLALASMGAALIYGTTRLSNFAHAEMVTWGGLVAVVTTSMWMLPPWIGIAAAVIGGALLGWAMDAGIWRPLRRRGLGIV